MNTNKILWAITFGSIGIYFIYKGLSGFISPSDPTVDGLSVRKEPVSVAAEYEVYSDNLTGLEFTYRSGPDGYVVDDVTDLIDPTTREVLVKVLVMMTKEDKLAMETGPDRGGPPTINIMVFKNKQQLSPREWLNDAPLFSNVDFLQGAIVDDTVAGEAAVRYFTEGMFQSENLVIAKGDYVYHLTGSFTEENSTIHQDFKHVLKTLAL